MVILGIDASSSVTGWSIVDCSSLVNVALIAFGEIELTKFKKKKFPLEYLQVLFLSISDLIKKYL
jgi:Holliday junction resolvasome RuvABC endonuclease subunit